MQFHFNTLNLIVFLFYSYKKQFHYKKLALQSMDFPAIVGKQFISTNHW